MVGRQCDDCRVSVLTGTNLHFDDDCDYFIFFSFFIVSSQLHIKYKLEIRRAIFEIFFTERYRQCSGKAMLSSRRSRKEKTNWATPLKGTHTPL